MKVIFGFSVGFIKYIWILDVFVEGSIKVSSIGSVDVEFFDSEFIIFG